MTAFANSGFEFLAAIGVFGIIGFMATNQGVGIEDVATQSIGLAFVAFPKVFTVMGPFGIFFGILFFLCLLFAGLTSSISLVEAFASAVIDKTGISRKKIVTVTCLGGYLVSILYTTGAGLYFLDIIDAFMNSYAIVTIGFAEAFVVGWLLGPKIIRDHTNAISYYPIGKWWDIMIKYVTPVVLVYMIIQNLINEISKPYGGYPLNALLILGWGAIILGLVSSYFISRSPWRGSSLTHASNYHGGDH